MIHYYKTLGKNERIFFWVSIAVILAGIALRIIVWAHSRDLIIDEANITRNLFEKDFSQLAGRLDYEQYAPVMFMWIEKCFVSLYGFSEHALTAWPMITGIATLVVFMLVLKEFVSWQSLWYALAFLALGHFFVRYSTEVKQYMGDALVCLSLLLLALRTDILSGKKASFILKWAVAGSIAVWSSMPSVFILTGVGAYYLWTCITAKRWTAIMLYAAPAIFALAQFGAYYMIVLRSDAHSDYLQNFHADYFLVATPGSVKEWKHNWYLSSELIKLAVGYTVVALLFNFPLIAWGGFRLIRKETAKGLLVLIPLFITAFAAAINEFSLIPRVALFTMPLFLIMLAVGFDRLFSVMGKARLLAAAMGVLCVILFNGVNMIWKPFVSEQITWALQLMKDNNVQKQQLHISAGSYPSYLYYTTIHPEHQRWEKQRGAAKENWDADWRQVAANSGGKFGAIFTTIPESQASAIRADLSKEAKEVAAIHTPSAKCYAYVLIK